MAASSIRPKTGTARGIPDNTIAATPSISREKADPEHSQAPLLRTAIQQQYQQRPYGIGQHDEIAAHAETSAPARTHPKARRRKRRKLPYRSRHSHGAMGQPQSRQSTPWLRWPARHSPRQPEKEYGYNDQKKNGQPADPTQYVTAFRPGGAQRPSRTSKVDGTQQGAEKRRILSAAQSERMRKPAPTDCPAWPASAYSSDCSWKIRLPGPASLGFKAAKIKRRSGSATQTAGDAIRTPLFSNRVRWQMRPRAASSGHGRIVW